MASPTIRGMELTPDLLLEAKFAPARRGYDMAEVDDFLERCAEGLDVLLARLKAEFERAERAEAEVLRLRTGRPDEAAAPAPDAGASAPEAAPPALEPEAPVDLSVDEPMRILIHAERTAEAAIADARAEAQRIRTEAESVASTQRSEAEALLATAKAEAETEAKRAGDEMRRSIQTEVMALRGDRDALNDDVRNLRRWLDEQRTRLRTTARELQRLVDDPAALRELPVPELAGSEQPTAADGAEPSTDHDEEPSDGEPTQAVAAVGGMSIFDDPDDRDEPVSAGSDHQNGEQLS